VESSKVRDWPNKLVTQMLARLLRVLLLALLAIAAAWWWWSARLGWSTVSRAAVGLLIVLPHAPVLAIEFLLLSVWGDPRPAGRPGGLALMRAWLGEVWWGICTFGWRQPFAAQAVPDDLGQQAAERTGVLLVHGFVCNRGLWNPWMRELRVRGIPFVAVSLEPVFGAIDAYAEPIDAAIRKLEAATGRPPLIVAHSMGGLAARAWLRRLREPRRCAGIVTVGTPHHGTWLARFAFSRNGRQMQRGSAWLRELNDHDAKMDVPFDCYYSHCDNIVFPAATATLPGARNVHVPGRAHIYLLGSRQLFDEVLARLGHCEAVPLTTSL
jgi:pimeloyl-ACP methyl ester carboxylesterase